MECKKRGTSNLEKPSVGEAKEEENRTPLSSPQESVDKKRCNGRVKEHDAWEFLARRRVRKRDLE